MTSNIISSILRFIILKFNNGLCLKCLNPINIKINIVIQIYLVIPDVVLI